MLSLDDVLRSVRNYWSVAIRLFRLGPAFLPYFLAFFVGVACASSWTFKIIPACIVIFFVSCAGHTANYVVDVEVDKITTKVKERDPKFNPVLTGEISSNKSLLLVTVLLIISICLALLVSYIFTLMTLIGIFGAVICYSLLYFKSKAPLDLIFPITASAPLLIAGYYMNGNLPFPTLEVLVYTLAATILFLETEIYDIKFDSLTKVYTTAVRLGRNKTKVICYSLYVIGLIISIFGYLAAKDLFFAFMAPVFAFVPATRSLMVKAYVMAFMLTIFIVAMQLLTYSHP